MSGTPRPAVRDGLAVNLASAALLVGVGLLVAAAGVVLGLLLGGRPQALGAALGAGLTTGFYVFGTVTVSLVAAYAPRASLVVALLTYVLQVALLALVLAAVQDSPAAGTTLDVRWTGGAVVVSTVLWLVVLVTRALRSVKPVSEPRLRA